MLNRLKQLKPDIRHPFSVPFLTIGLLIVLTGGSYLVARSTHNLPPSHDAKVVIITHDHQQQIVPSKESTVGLLLQKLHIKLNQGDLVEPAASTHINQDQFRINIYRAVPVQIVDGSQRINTFSASKTSRSVAQQAGSTVFPEDKLETVPSNDFLSGGTIGEQVVINRATPIKVDLYGTPVVIRTHATTVGDLIKEKNIKLAPNDQIIPSPKTPLDPNQQVAFIRTGTKTETITENIPNPVQTINDPSLAYGTSAVRQQGSPGQQVVTYQVALTNNVETARNVIQKVVTKEPVVQIVVRGVNLGGIKGDMALAGIAPSDYNYVDYIFTHESHWNPAALNASGCAGLGQACPGSKLSNVCPNWRDDPICQIKFFNGYAVRTYHSWASAYSHKVNTGWW